MSTVEQIESAILTLPLEDFRRVAEWVAAEDERRWDEQLAVDVAAGRLEVLAAEARDDDAAGRTREV